MKITLHVPVEQYGFVAIEIENDEIADAKIAGEKADADKLAAFLYKGFSEAFKPQPINSLETKQWHRFIERVLQGEPNHIEELEQCSPEQKKIINEIKKALSRLEARHGKETRDRFNETNE